MLASSKLPEAGFLLDFADDNRCRSSHVAKNACISFLPDFLGDEHHNRSKGLPVLVSHGHSLDPASSNRILIPPSQWCVVVNAKPDGNLIPDST